MKNQTNLSIAQQLKNRLPKTPLYTSVINSLENVIENVTPHAGIDVWEEYITLIMENGVSIVPTMATEENIMEFVGKHAYEIIALLDKLKFDKAMGSQGFKQMAYISYKFVCEDIKDELFSIQYPIFS